MIFWTSLLPSLWFDWSQVTLMQSFKLLLAAQSLFRVPAAPHVHLSGVRSLNECFLFMSTYPSSNSVHARFCILEFGCFSEVHTSIFLPMRNICSGWDISETWHRVIVRPTSLHTYSGHSKKNIYLQFMFLFLRVIISRKDCPHFASHLISITLNLHFFPARSRFFSFVTFLHGVASVTSMSSTLTSYLVGMAMESVLGTP